MKLVIDDDVPMDEWLRAAAVAKDVLAAHPPVPRLLVGVGTWDGAVFSVRVTPFGVAHVGLSSLPVAGQES